jgi:hypothetical protein
MHFLLVYTLSTAPPYFAEGENCFCGFFYPRPFFPLWKLIPMFFENLPGRGQFVIPPIQREQKKKTVGAKKGLSWSSKFNLHQKITFFRFSF